MKIGEIRELTTAEVMERLDAEKAALNQMEINHAVSPLESPAKIRASRRLIAQLITVLRESEQN